MRKKTRAQEKVFCSDCLFLIRKNELCFKSDDELYHINCQAAIRDGSGRFIHPDFKHFLNGFDISILESK